jgi:ketosteroid isomerase-like protein
MTKLEELKAAYAAADEAASDAWDNAWDADAAWTAWGAYEAAWSARNVAWVAYRAELKKTQKENSND